MRCHPGDHVTIRAVEWRVLRTLPFSDCEALEVVQPRSGETRTFLLPFDRPGRAPDGPPRLVSRRRWARDVAALVHGSFPYGGLRSCPGTIRLLPYQLEPALAMLRHGFLRVLVADDVGLGKTIEAGIVVREIVRRDTLARVLVLCPAGLLAQWRRELAALFELDAVEASAAWLGRAGRDLPPDVNPWSLPGTYLASTDFVKRPEALRPLEDVRWDLLVLDEAHHATPGSGRRAAVEALAARSTRLLLLTATPHSGDEAQFRALCALGGHADPVVFFSRTRGDAGVAAAPARRVVLRVRLSAAEAGAHRLLEAYTEEICRHAPARRSGSAELLAGILRKRALSCPVSLARSVRRRLELLDAPPFAPAQLLLPLAEEDPADEEPLAGLGTPVLEDGGAERLALRAILQAADAAGAHDSKLNVLRRLLRRSREAAIVFSEYRDTAIYIAQALSADGRRVMLLHGGLAEDERRRALAAFLTGGAVLVATDTASEGLNLHHCCRLVVHFELPWTPSRLHQRAGRVDRIGQTRRVHEIALVAADTAEQLVLAPLLGRAARSGTLSRGALVAQLSEAQVSAHILSRTPLPRPAPVPLPASLVTLDLGTEADAEVARLTLLRTLGPAVSNHAARDAGPGVRLTSIRSPPHRPGELVAVYRILLRDGRGDTIEDDVVPVRIALRGPRLRPDGRPSTCREQITAVLERAEPHVARALEEVVAARRRIVEPLHQAACRRLEHHVAASGWRLRSAAREFVQAALFDRRPLREREARQRTGEMLLEEERARLSQVTLSGEYRLQAVFARGLR